MCKSTNRHVYLVVITICILILGFCTKNTVAAYEEGEVSNGGTINGTVKFTGDMPEAKMLTIDKDQKTCGHDPIPSEALILSSGGMVKNAVVSISNISKGKKFKKSDDQALDQKECVFIPHVSIIPPGRTINLLNSDDVMHNLHSWSMKNTAFNEGVAGGGKLEKTFEHPETIKITCDVHKWMSSWIIVQDNPYYALTDDNGNFKIEDIPPGTYTLEAWQESLGKVTQEVSVKSGEATKVNFEMEMKEKRRRR